MERKRPKAETITDEPAGKPTRSRLRIYFGRWTHQTPEGLKELPEGLLTRVLSKWFEAEGKAIVLAGEEYDDHDLWQIEGGKAYLIGTLTPVRFKELLHLRKGSPLSLKCDSSNFSWLDHGWPGQTLTGKGVSAYDLGDRATGPPFTFAEKA
jgi:hypothetical protein